MVPFYMSHGREQGLQPQERTAHDADRHGRICGASRVLFKRGSSHPTIGGRMDGRTVGGCSTSGKQCQWTFQATQHIRSALFLGWKRIRPVSPSGTSSRKNVFIQPLLASRQMNFMEQMSCISPPVPLLEGCLVRAQNPTLRYCRGQHYTVWSSATTLTRRAMLEPCPFLAAH